MKSELTINLFLFLGTLVCAWWFQWQATDLVWSLWLSSITIGYLTLIGSPFLLPLKHANNVNWKEVIQGIKEVKFTKNLMAGFFILLLVGLFFLAFFTIHFGMFHYVHGAFLSDFFPLKDIQYPRDPWKLPSFIFTLLPLYWPFVLASAISQFNRQHPELTPNEKKAPQMLGPYRAVIRMHCLIFVFAGLKALHATNFIFYAAVLFAYFFPWGAVWKKRV